MSLVSVVREDLPLGVPLPWPLFDQAGNELLPRGSVLQTVAEVEALLAGNALRELELGQTAPAEPRSEEAEAASKDLDAALAGGKDSGVTFQDMRLRVGDRIQFQPPANVGLDRYIVRLIGYLEGATLLVTAPFANGLRLPVRENDRIVARIFSSQKAFGFSTKVERVCKIPYDYLHLSFPDRIQGSVVRKSPRVRTRIIASIGTADAKDGDNRQPGVIANLSADGALVKARQVLAAKDGNLHLSFRINLHGIDAYLTVNAVVRSTFRDEQREGDAVMVNHGVQFLDLPPNDSVILQSLIYQQMIEQPHSLT